MEKIANIATGCIWLSNLMDNENINLNGVTVIIDGNYLAYRAFHGAPPLMANGMPTGVIHIFLTVLNKLIHKEGITKVVTVFDAKGKNKRHEMSSDYKATREAMPEDLACQLELLKEIVPFTGSPVYCISGYEADDVINTLVKDIDSDIWILTKDKDLHQLVDDRVKIYDYKTEVLIGRQEVFEKFGLYPENMQDFLGLAGDKSDNIPGVSRVGEKTAVKLLNEYGNLDNIYSHIEEVKGTIKDRLIEEKDKAYFSKKLAELMYIDDLPEISSKRNVAELKKIYEKYQLRQLLVRLTGNSDEKNVIDDSNIKPFKEGKVENPEITVFVDNKIYIVGNSCYEEFNGSVALKKCYDVKSLIKAGLTCSDDVFDIMLVSWLINADSGGIKKVKTESIDIFLAKVYIESKGLEEKLRDLNLEKLYRDIELPVAKILAYAEIEGITVDSLVIRKVAKSLKEEVMKVLTKISNRAGEEININSPKQLSQYLYHTLGLKPLKKNKQGYSTDEETLLDLKEFNPDYSEIIDDILKYRELNKFLSTYTINMLEFLTDDDKIHTVFKQTGTATGRLSSHNPNLQNIPKSSSYAKELRSAFIAKEGYSFVSFDYSQIELRVLAHLSEDETLISSFKNNIDIHNLTAKKVFHLNSDEEVTSPLRRIAKAVNFGILYGLSSFSLAKDVKVSQNEAKSFIDGYFSLYQKVGGFLDDIIKNAKEKGYCQTLLGRKRFIQDINSKNGNIRQRAERMALNAPIQGTAADIIKLAMIDCHKYIKENNIDAKLILQIHDELIFEVKDEITKDFEKNIANIMENVIKLKVNLTVNSSIGKNWGEI